MSDVQFTRIDGSQMFVRADDPETVLKAIAGYVKNHGCEGMFEAVDERLGSHSDRKEREFALAPPEDGWITVWEDGQYADRRLAEFLSEALDTEVRWLMVSTSTDSWAHGEYENGSQKAFEYEEDVDAATEAGEYADGLPHALRFMADPNLGSYAAKLDIPILKEMGIDIGQAFEDNPGDPGPDGLVRKTLPCAAT